MGGEIKVVKKDGPGTLMQLFLKLSTPLERSPKNDRIEFRDHNVIVSKNTHLLFSFFFNILTVI